MSSDGHEYCVFDCGLTLSQHLYSRQYIRFHIRFDDNQPNKPKVKKQLKP